jgi:hypothetical protein
MKTLTFQYRFTFPDHSENFEITLDPRKIELIAAAPELYPQWVNLDFHQCSNCPFDAREIPHCPLTANVFHIVTRCSHAMSYNEIHLEVITPERIISRDTTVQRALSSLFGLVIASSSCPHTRFFRPMARFHLPVSSEEETVYRMTSMYMLAQYFRKQSGKDPDFEMRGLKKICQDIEIVNASISKRLRAASQTDSAVNAVILLDVFAKALPWAIEASLEEVGYLFEPYIASLD